MLAQTRVRRIYKSLATLMADFVFLVSGFALVYLARFDWFTNYFKGEKLITGLDYFYYTLFFSIVIIILFAFSGLYETGRRRTLLKQFLSIVGVILLVNLAIIAFLFFNEYNDAIDKINRSILAIISPILISMVFLGRLIINLLTKITYRYGFLKIDIAILGNHPEWFLKYINSRKDISNVYVFEDFDSKNWIKIEDLMKKRKIDEIYLSETTKKTSGKIAELAERHKINFIYNPNSFHNYSAYRVQPVEIGKYIYLESVHSKLDGWNIVLKRIFDILGAFVITVLTSPILITVSILIWLEDRGPVFYKSERIGPNGKVFLLWKFRRMKIDLCTSEDGKNKEALEYEAKLIKENDMRQDGILYKIKDDPRNTKIGAFIEKYSIDELAQLINIFLGNMSLVGPRPHQPREVAKYKVHHYKTLNIKPGITGLAQISGRSDLKFEEEVGYDVKYLENWSLLLDTIIILKTPFVIIFKKHKN